MWRRFTDNAAMVFAGACGAIAFLKLSPPFADLTQDLHWSWFIGLAMLGLAVSSVAYINVPTTIVASDMPDSDEVQRRLWANRMIGHGWKNLGFAGYGLGDHPSLHDEVEIIRYGWDVAEIIKWREMDPQMNIYDLWWRPHQNNLSEPAAVSPTAT